MTESNPIERLLDALPAAVAKQKRATIQAELEEAGVWEHYRQSVRKPGRDMGKINVRAAVIFKRNLGIGDDFFIGTPEHREKETARIVRGHYDQLALAV